MTFLSHTSEAPADARAAAWGLVLQVALSCAAMVMAFFLLVEDSLFAALWRRGVPVALYSLLFALVAVAPVALLVPGARRMTAVVLVVTAGALTLIAGVAQHRDWLLAAVLFLLLAGTAARSRFLTASRVELVASFRALARRSWRLALGLAAVAAIAGATRVASTARAAHSSRASSDARALLRQVVDAARTMSLWRDTVSWSAVEDSAEALLAGARTAREAYPAARYVLAALGDGHSALDERPSEWASSPVRLTNLARASSLPITSLERGNIAFVEVPWFIAGVSDAPRWRSALHQGMRSLDAQRPCGWIVDLRRNLGGDMWPMLQGVAPLLPDGIAGGVAMPRRASPAHWWIVNGRAYSAVPIAAGLDWWRGSARIVTGEAPVAVLLSRQTASSGEAVAIAFVARSDTRFFGDSTAGLTTANTAVTLVDGSRAAITVGVDIDRHGRRYGGALVPDELIRDSSSVRRRAADWIMASGRCANTR